MEAELNARQSDGSGGVEGRPYRSHLHPACLPCKRRKSRCRTSSGSSDGCIMCQAHGTECIFPQVGDSVDGKAAKTIRSPRKLSSAKSRPTRLARSRTSWQRMPPGPMASPSGPQRLPQPVQPSDGIRSAQEGDAQAARTPALCRSGEPCLDDGTRGETVSNLTGIGADAGDHNGPHIVSPAVADDDDVLASYLSTFPGTRRPSMVRASQNMNRPRRPVLFNTVPKRPLGISSNQTLAGEKCKIIEKFIEPGVEDVVDLFFQKANTCFPVFDEASFRHAYSTHKEKISPALLCNLYANALIYWESSPNLRGQHCPDIRFIWNQATEALHSELFLSPGTSTVMAIILNVCGRPSTSIFGNGGMVGTAVALCNALGLNRDPSSWNISPLEKRFRMRIWWLVVVLDRWCSLAYGTSLQIHRAQYDVPFPTVDDLCGPNPEPPQMAAASVFMALTTLTEVLSRYLEHVYRVSKAPPCAPEMSTTDLELLLSEWEESLGDDIRRLALRGTHLNGHGAANFRLAYLAVKLLLRRIKLDIDRVSSSEEVASAATVTSPFYIQAQRAAEEIVHLVQELDEHHIRGFWIPVNAFSLTSATTFLLRSALRAGNPSTSAPLRMAQDMVNTLHSHRWNFYWDLADNCLTNRGDLVEKISSGRAGNHVLNPTFPDFQECFWDMDVSVGDELFTGVPGLADAIEAQFQVD